MNDEYRASRKGQAARRLVRAGAALAVGFLGVQLGAMTPAHAGEATLALPYYAQTESNWCAIASAKMLLAYYGSTVQECEMANLDFGGGNNCCANPSSSACNPSTGSFTGKPAAYYGLSYSVYPNNSFSFAQFESEINAGRPVSIGWNWTCSSPPCGGHAMNVAGYDAVTSGNYLELWDPDHGAGCPAGEDTCWLTYASYFGGSGYNHTAQSPLYDIKWSPVCSSDYFDLPGSEMQQCFDTWTHRGDHAAALTATNSGGSLLYSGSYQSGATNGWYQFTGLSVSAYQTEFNTLSAQGYRPSQVSMNSTSSGWLVNAIFTPAEGAFASYTGMSQTTFTNEHNALTAAGYVIVDLFATNDASNNPLFAATWVKTTSQGQFPQLNITAANYQSVFNAEVAAGRRPTRVTAYDNLGTTEYAVIWQNDGGVGFSSANGWAESSFVVQDLTDMANGLHLSYVSALNNVFSGIWTN
ncbi:MAG TPA: C39 family peptidase [Polyangia bacterium]|nr:C39 family peptidase [Polyangia bacterium]